MTTPSTETLEREKDKLYVTDAELIRRLGVPEKIGRAVTPEEFAKEMGWGAKRVRQLAKKLGACRVLGNRMALMPEDIEVILEATKLCPSSYSNDERKTAISGTTAGRSATITYEDRLALRTRKTPRVLRPRSSTSTSTVISMDRTTR